MTHPEYNVHHPSCYASYLTIYYRPTRVVIYSTFIANTMVFDSSYNNSGLNTLWYHLNKKIRGKKNISFNRIISQNASLCYCIAWKFVVCQKETYNLLILL